ncbi:hypothetical protein [Ureaplasma urealyticum]|uniref:hypothetical protein n=1 Tax=Ureaplasma urealyticum TaxID=2130 RepID=UPI0002FEB3BE|nr:hypothetical protein [Ureaplasma urealyticum]
MQKLMDTFFKKKLKVPRPISDDISVRVKNLYAIYDEKQENELVALNNISYDFKKIKSISLLVIQGLVNLHWLLTLTD